jgi:hypothetical protein
MLSNYIMTVSLMICNNNIRKNQITLNSYKAIQTVLTTSKITIEQKRNILDYIQSKNNITCIKTSKYTDTQIKDFIK